MLKELIPYVDAKYRVASGRQNRAMAGLSAGGAATYNVGLKHLELFSAFGMFSAAGGGGADFATRYPQLAADPKGTNAKINVFWIGCGTEDPLDKAAKTFDAELTKLQIKHAYADREGGHVWPIWRWALAEFAPCSSSRPNRDGACAIDHSARAERRRVMLWLGRPIGCSPLPSDVDAVARSQRIAEDLQQVLRRAAVADDVDGRSIDVVVLVLGRLFLESVLKHFQIGFGNRSDEQVRFVVVEIDHGCHMSDADHLGRFAVDRPTPAEADTPRPLRIRRYALSVYRSCRTKAVEPMSATIVCETYRLVF